MMDKKIEQIKAIKPFIYLATPYSRYPRGTEAAFHAACAVSAWLIRAGVLLFCPIAHSHTIALAGSIDPCDHAIWLPADRPLMVAAGGLVIAMLDGWEESYGVRMEAQEFTEAGKPIVHLPWPPKE